MFGDILSDLTGELAGSLGIAPSLNASDDRAITQAAHGSAPDIAGRGLANPIAMILSAGMLLAWLGAGTGTPGSPTPRCASRRASVPPCAAASAPATSAARPRPGSSPTPWWPGSPGEGQGPPSTCSRRAAAPARASAPAVAHSTPAEPTPAASSPTVLGMST